MKVVITDFALKEIKSIHKYYKRNASKNVADKLANKIFDTIDLLEHAPQAGTIEPRLKQLRLHHRYIVAGNYKIIFRTSDNVLYVTDVFDTRQNPKKISARNK